MSLHPDDRAAELEAIAMLPKVELHLHLEGAAPPAFIQSLARAHNADISAAFDADGSYAFDDFKAFLKSYEIATSVLKGPEDYAALLREVLAQSAAQNVIYTELFISPDFCGGGDLGAWREHLAAMQEEAANAEREDGITMRGIATAVRHFGPEQAKQTAKVTAETVGDFITGFGIGGAEDYLTLPDFAWSFDCAREAGLELTAHAGEWRGPASVREALSLGVSRVGHGVRAIEDRALVEELVERKIMLEVCPGSNVTLGVYPDLAHHPIERLRAEGVRVSISTDDPPFFHTTLKQEYPNIAECFGWDKERFMVVNRNSLDAAFCDSETRGKLMQKLSL